MHLLYVDESGSPADASHDFFVLAGVSVFERRTHWIEQDLNRIAARFCPEDPHSIELHGSPMRGGRDRWRKFPVQARLDAVCEALRVSVVGSGIGNVRLFAVVVRKSSIPGVDPVQFAFEHLCSRFDLFLTRLHAKHNNSQRGLMVFDKSATEPRIQTLAREFKYAGHSWGKTRNYAEVPVFLDSRASRLIQLADLVSYAVFRKYQSGENLFFDVIKDCFDREGNVIHGLCEQL
ncbi:DUF3800 domain-containing protein [Tahibacter sp. UC22_41]|uniref:DUF3800 domain-containing protein n=1 Tax=Tahibacter sp. UC22_41 TaxID=3350178 RepID=UPI0036D77390